MNERAPKFEHTTEEESNVENLADWRALKEAAPEAAEQILESIESMQLTDKIVALKSELEALAEDNANRFVAEVIATQIAVLEEEVRHAARMEQLAA